LSAILKALKRIEQESSGKMGSPSASRKLDAKKALNQRTRKSWLFGRLSHAIGLVAVLVAAIVLGFAYAPSLLKGNPSSSKLTDLSRESEKGKNLSAPRQQQQSEDTRGKMAKSPDPLSVPSPKKRPPVSQESPGAAQESPQIAQQPPGRTQELPRMVQETPTTPQRLIEEPLPQAEEQTQTETQPALELQAIVWSDAPESRFAVINGHIVRANGMVDGVKVTEIRQDTVSLKLGERVWKVKMVGGN
jgi:hypothetical protein